MAEGTGLEIAVIGMSGRFPGARNIDEFWENLKNGVESLLFYTHEELEEAGVDPELLKNPDYVNAGGGLLEEVDYFDAVFFDYLPVEAAVLDPQIRLFHECAWEALENAGYDPGTYKGKIGLYAGASSSTKWENLVSASGKADEVGRFASSSLINKDNMSTRVSYKLDLKGPAFMVQTACSTSLLAIDLACRGILTGQCSMALAGGVSISLSISPSAPGKNKKGYLYKEGMIRPLDGHCWAFDAKAKGTVSGEGVGIVVLKLLEEALQEGDTIHAVIKGTAANNDGKRKVGYTAPSVEGQAEVIRAAHLMAEVEPESITYIETHGTGTPLGDPIEVEALKQGFGTGKKGFCGIGSVKTNIGHLDAAAGAASFIKTVLALKYRQIPPTLFFDTPNPTIDFINSPFYVNNILAQWKHENNTQPLRAAVSAFGIGGTNVHMVLEEARGGRRESLCSPGNSEPQLIALSAATESALEKMTENLADYLKENLANPGLSLANMAYTLQVGRKSFNYRRILAASSMEEAAVLLESRDPRKVYTASPEYGPGKSKVESMHSSAAWKTGWKWLAGERVDWQALHKGEKRQRIPLPVYPFERQRYWVEGPGADKMMKKGRKSLADRFYLPTWKRMAGPVRGNESEKSTWLVFLDRCGLGTLLEKCLKEGGHEVITVMPGTEFARREKEKDSHSYTINPQRSEDYLQLFNRLESLGKSPDQVLHLWSLTGNSIYPGRRAFEENFEQTQILGFYSLLNIAKSSGNQEFILNVISDHWREVTGEEELDPGKSTMLGPLLVIPQEYANIRCRGIDIVLPEPGSRYQEIQVDQLLAELSVKRGYRQWEILVAFRGFQRLVKRFESLHPEDVAVGTAGLPLREEGVYLITGGLGVIGFTLAEFLAGEYRARLILIGRSGRQGEEKVKKVEKLETLGAEVLVVGCDCADEEQMRFVIEEAEQRWGKIHGVIHAAGILQGSSFSLIHNLQPEDCSAQFRSKVYGTRALEKLFRDKEPDFCWLMSSISTVLGGLQFAAYAAANAFMDGFVSGLKHHGKTGKGYAPWISVDWDGMPPQETIESFKGILSLSPLYFNRLVTARGGNLYSRLKKWVQFESFEQESISGSPPGETTGLHPRPPLSTPYVSPYTGVQQSMVGVWKRILGFDRIGVRDNFLELGGDSLRAITLLSAIHEQMDAAVPLTVFFDGPTVENLAKYIEGSETSTYTSVLPGEKKAYYPLSSAQKRVYFLQQMDPDSTGYNMPLVYPLGKGIEEDRLESALKELIHRHESLRTSFRVIRGEPFQVIHNGNDIDFAVEYYNSAAEEEFGRPFDLSRAPLIRSGLIRLPGGSLIWLLNLHHIVSDGTSLTILTEDFMRLYRGETMAPLRLQYKDFARWQNFLLESGKIKSREDYWLGVLSGDIQRLNLPTDDKRPEVFTFAGDHYSFMVGPGDAVPFKALASDKGGTLYMNILAALNTLFYKYTGQTDIIIGSGIAGRSHTDLQGIVGMFVNTLVMRNFPQEDKTYLSFLQEVIAGSVRAFDNQEYQFEELVERLDPPRDPSRNPLFDISMVVQNFRRPGENRPERQLDAGVEELPEADEELPTVKYKNATSKFDMTFFVREFGEGVRITVEYYASIFKVSFIQRLESHLKNVIKAVVKDPAVKLRDIEIISPEEKQRVLEEFNDTAREFPMDKTIHELFEDRVDKTPDAAALVYEDCMITYDELDGEANRLARYLYDRKGIKPGDRIGILMSQSLARPAAVLGALKSGGSYIPIDSSVPRERLKYMISDAGIGTIISEKRYIKMLNPLQWECGGFHSYLCVDSFDVHREEEAERNELMDEELWEHVGQTAVDDITGGGWLSSYTGEPLSRAEMDEYGDNVLKKLEPLLHGDMRVLEIGCASGISMYRMAPKVGLYYGTDLSAVIIDKNKEIVKQKNHQNIKLSCLAAHEIDQLEEKNFDLIVMNSVIQCFHGHNYLRNVIRKAIDSIGQAGYLFIGDVMDHEKKEDLVRELKEFRRKNRNNEYIVNTKTDFSSELFVSRGFWKDLEVESEEIEAIEFSRKIYTIENELTKFRYDVLLRINKGKSSASIVEREKRKYQDDRRCLLSFGSGRLGLNLSPHNLAYIIYTSGTTGVPKGVMVNHGSVVNLGYWHNRNYQITGIDHAALYAGFGFDASVWELFPYLFKGSALYLVDDSVKLDPGMLNRYFERRNISIAFLPTQFCEQFMFIDEKNHSLRVLLTGGDKLRFFTRRSYKVYNNYGPTENTVVTTSFPVESLLDNIPIGSPVDNCRVYILDTMGLHMQPVGIPGELCISGAGLARGYLNNPEITNTKFRMTDIKKFYGGPGGGFSKEPPGRRRQEIYLTGDLARWLPEGYIEILGRIDDQVKIRGYRIELGEIENRLLEHEHVDEAVVIASEADKGDKYLSAYLVPCFPGIKDSLDAGRLREYLSTTLPDYMIPSHFILMEKIPLTPGGKIDRKALPEPGFDTGGDHTAPRNEIERKLAAIWSEVLGFHLRGESPAVGIDDNFFNLGGHSLKATVLVSRIHKDLHVKIPLAEIFKIPTIRGMFEYIKGTEEERYASIEPVEKRDYYPLTSAQKRMYVLQKLEPDNIGYNMPQVIHLGEAVDPGGLELAFRRMIARHESLRTSFEMAVEEPVQRIHEIENSKLHIENIGKDFVQPFDLSKAPLLRVGLSVSKKQNILMVDMHHIINDGMSQGILVEEFRSLYAGAALSPLRLQYKDYAQWQNRGEQQEAARIQEGFWLKEFSGEIGVLNLPLDFSRPAVQSFEGRTVGFSLTPAESGSLNALAAQEGVTLYMLSAAIFNIFLSKLSGQEDVVLGTVTAGRRHADLERIIGMFVNTLALRNYPAGNRLFTDFLKEVKERTLRVFENQEYPFEELVEKVNVVRDVSRNPLFDVLFILQNLTDFKGVFREPNGETAAKNDEDFDYENRIAKFDLTLVAVEMSDRLRFSFQYCTKLFKEETIARFIAHFKMAVTSILENPAKKIAEIEIILPEEKDRILYEFNCTGSVYPADKTVHELFADQVEKTPDSIVLIGPKLQIKNYKRVSVSYRELNKELDRLACLLWEKGIGPAAIVGIMLERSVEMIIGILGILKAGGAYLPIDPAYPQERINYIMADSGAQMLLAEDNLSSWLSSAPEAGLNLSAGHPSSPAYIIYTSGTTGNPKGVMIRHISLINFIFSMYKDYSEDFGPWDNCLGLTNFCFDVSVCEVFMPLVFGASVVLLPQDRLFEPGQLAETIVGESVTFTYIPPGLLKEVCDKLKLYSGKLELNKILVGVEPIKDSILEDYVKLNPAVQIINGYGPTEATICATAYRYYSRDPGDERVPIGTPLGNMEVLLLDKYGNPVPVGVPGELCISGIGLACGYLNNPELTAEKFLDLTAKTRNGSRRSYRTGDMAKWLSDGNILFIGRIDQQVKIRGFRIELGEIENHLLKHEAIRGAVVTAKEGTSLCAYITADKPLSITGLRDYLSGSLPDFMIPSYFVQVEKIPLTANGKVNKKALPEPDLSGISENYEAPRNEIEEKLTAVWVEVLFGKEALNRSPLPIGIDDNFFEAGGDSIKAIQISARLQTHGLKLEIKDLFLNTTIKQLSKYVKPVTRKIDQAPVEGEVPLTPVQRWFFDNNFTNRHHFNQAVMLYREDGFKEELLSSVFKKIAAHHDALRMVYSFKGDRVIQENRGLEGELFRLEVIHPDRYGDAVIEKEMGKEVNRIQAGIDLESGPLVHLALFKTDRGDHLLIVIHHLVIDGVSWRILLEDLAAGYGRADRGEEIVFPDKTDSFKYWSRELGKYAESGELLKELDYWQGVENEDVPALPRDFEISREERTFKNCETVGFRLSSEETGKLLREVNRAYNTEINDILLAALGMAVKEWCGNAKVLINLEGHGREGIIEGIDISRTVGWFTSLFPVVLDMDKGDDLSYRVKVVKETLKRMPNKGIGYGILKYLTPEEKKQGIKFRCEPPISFNYLGQFGGGNKPAGSIFSRSGMGVGEIISPDLETKYALDINGMIVKGSELVLSFIYNKKEYKKSSIQQLAGYYEANLVRIIDHCTKKEEKEITPSDLTYSEFSLDEFEELTGKLKDLVDVQ